MSLEAVKSRLMEEFKRDNGAAVSDPERVGEWLTRHRIVIATSPGGAWHLGNFLLSELLREGRLHRNT